MAEHPGSARDIDYTSGVPESPTPEYEKNGGDNIISSSSSSNNNSDDKDKNTFHSNSAAVAKDDNDDDDDDDDEPYVHDQLPNVEEVRMRAATALTMVTDAHRATTTTVRGGQTSSSGRSMHSSRICRVRDCSTMKWIFWVGLLLMVIAIIVLTVGIVRYRNSESNTITLDRKQVEEFLVSNGFATNEELQDESSPQWDAVSWLVQLDGDGREPLPVNGGEEETAFFLQRYVLVLLYYATDGPFWYHSRNLLRQDWNTCGWNSRVNSNDGNLIDFGAFCNDEGIVNKIFISYTNLRGAIPRELGYLSKLEYLALSNNVLEGELPSELQLLTNLDYLALQGNELTGSIPFWIDQLTLLQVLGLSGNFIEGSIPSAIGKLTRLETLGLDENVLEGDLQNLQDLKEMKHLYLSDNSLTGPLASTHLLSMRQLEELDLSGNDFEGSVPTDVFSFSKLRILDLRANRLDGPMPSGRYTGALALRTLSLNYNDLSGTISESIGDLTSLTHLDLAGNEFNGTMPTALQGLVNLKYLFLADNPFDASSFPNLSRLTNLEDLSLKRTQITGEIPALTQLSKLVMLDLDDNELVGEIPTELSRLTNLQYLFLNRNEDISGTVPVGIQILPSLSKSKCTSWFRVIAWFLYVVYGTDFFCLFFCDNPLLDVRVCSIEILLLSGTSITGSLEHLCNRTSNFATIDALSADCFGDDKEVECECCTICCADDAADAAMFGDGTNEAQACRGSVYYGDLDPIWQNRFKRGDYKFNVTDVTIINDDGRF